jgi:ankyrin repeat protein
MKSIALTTLVLCASFLCATSNAGARTQAENLALAINANDIDRVAAALDAGVDLSVEAYGDLPLNLALRQRRERIAQILLERGADPDQRNRRDDSALAALSPQEALAQSRIDSGLIALMIYSANERLICARELGLQTLELVLSRARNIDSVDASQMTPLMRAAMCGHANTMDVLLAAGSDPRTRNSRGETALHFAAATGAINVLPALLAISELDGRDINGASPLSHAAAGQSAAHVTAAELLLAAGADANARDASGNTPLMAAARGDNAAMMRLLLRSGADPNSTNDAGQNAHAVARGSMRDLLRNEARP